MIHTQADENSGALRGGFLRMKAQQDNTKKDDVFTFAEGILTMLSGRGL
jgi:hypothetical protein